MRATSEKTGRKDIGTHANSEKRGINNEEKRMHSKLHARKECIKMDIAAKVFEIRLAGFRQRWSV